MPGSRIVFRWRKWDGSPHWEHDCVFLGSDEWGDWFGQRAGWRSHRPGREMPAETANVVLLPAGTSEWVATLNAPAHRTRVYIDVAWRAGWREGEPAAIDMDLDVLRDDDRGTFVDDEDEWAAHQVRYGYPADVIARLEAVTARLAREVGARRAPFDEATAQRWLAVLEATIDGAAPGEPGRLDSSE